MPTRLVIPTADTPATQPFAPRRTITWQQIADDAKVEAIANLGDQWCQDYGIDGLGIASPTETLAERVAREQAEFEAGANRRALSDLDSLLIALDEIKAFLIDPDIEASANRANTVAPTTQELNRTLKALIRQERRAANLVTRLARYVFSQEHPELLDTID